MSTEFFVISESSHNELVIKAFLNRDFSQSESELAAKFSSYASWHGIRTHNAIKALHLDELFGSGSEGCKPNVDIEKYPSRFEAAETWNANRKLGQAVGYMAMDRAIELADKYGVGIVSVDNAFHYLWGGGYVMDAAKRGYLAYTNCTAALAEVVPFMGKKATLGTNPHSWGFPTTDAIGYPIVIDWATSVLSMGRVQQFIREGTALPPNAAIDAEGNLTTDATKAKAMVPFGAHKGYGLALINEIVGGLIGGGLPTLRSIWKDDGEKHAPCFFFQAIHPDAISTGAFAGGKNQSENIKAVLADILGEGNEKCLLPGQIEARSAEKCKQNGGLLFSLAEIEELNNIAKECGATTYDLSNLKPAT